MADKNATGGLGDHGGSVFLEKEVPLGAKIF
jgi:hypothetical protein